MPVSLHFFKVKILVFAVKNTSRKQILYVLPAEWTASLSFEPREKAGPVEDMFEFVAVQTNDYTFGSEVIEADGAGLGELERDLLVACAICTFALLEHLVMLVSQLCICQLQGAQTCSVAFSLRTEALFLFDFFALER